MAALQKNLLTIKELCPSPVKALAAKDANEGDVAKLGSIFGIAKDTVLKMDYRAGSNFERLRGQFIGVLTTPRKAKDDNDKEVSYNEVHCGSLELPTAILTPILKAMKGGTISAEFGLSISARKKAKGFEYVIETEFLGPNDPLASVRSRMFPPKDPS